MTRDDVIWVVGGGTSLAGFDFSRLRGLRTIAVNRAFEVLPDAELVYCSDRRFWQWHEKGLLAHTSPKCSMTELPGAEKWKATGISGLDLEPRRLRHGNSSGYAAINVAIQRPGVETIVLLGFDMKGVASPVPGTDGVHWHAGYPIPTRERVFQNMLPYFPSMLPVLKEVGVEVVNACPDSALGCFPKLGIDEALGYYGVREAPKLATA